MLRWQQRKEAAEARADRAEADSREAAEAKINVERRKVRFRSTSRGGRYALDPRREAEGAL
eukprot:6258466-Pyramimonas_sp.AAC.1